MRISSLFRPASAARPGSAAEVLAVFTRLGLTSFGGPVAHLGYFHDELVARRRWLDERAYAELVALCQFLPGPASSQVGIGIGLLRAGLPGALAAWVGFTWPSALVLILFALGLSAYGAAEDAAWLHGLKIAAVAVVAHALRQMAGKLAPDRPRATLALLAAAVVLWWPGAAMQVAVIAAGAVIGRAWLDGGRWAGSGSRRAGTEDPAATAWPEMSKGLGLALLGLFAALLLLLPLLGRAAADPAEGSVLALADAFYRAGALVFGGGHVVLPLLESAVVPTGWVSQSAFVAGYGAAQAVPGPLFTFAGYLGAAMAPGVAGIGLALVALAAIFLPSFLLVIGVLPLWGALRQRIGVRAALDGVNAVVVGILLAALYDPVWTSAIGSGADLALALLAYLGLAVRCWPPWLVVALCAVAAPLLSG